MGDRLQSVSSPDIRVPRTELSGTEELGDDALALKENASVEALPAAQAIKETQEKTELLVHKVLQWLIPAAVFVGFSFFLIAAGIYALHLLTPWGYLDAAQLDELHDMLFNGLVGAAVAGGVKKYMK